MIIHINDNECPICLNIITSKEKYITNCNHMFHKECITEWILNTYTCPICRTKVYPKLSLHCCKLTYKNIYKKIYEKMTKSQLEVRIFVIILMGLTSYFYCVLRYTFQ